MTGMTPVEMASALARGLLSFPVTNFFPDGALDPEGYRKNIAWACSHGPAGLFAAGGTGEFFSLTPREVATVLAIAVAEVNGRLPLLAPCGYGTGMAIEFARNAEAVGADGLLILPPYLTECEREGIAAHVEAVCRATRLGVIFYSRANATIDDLKSLRRLHPAVGSKNPGRRDQRAQRNHDGSEEVQGRSDLAPAKQRNTQKSGFEEEGTQHLICEQRPSDATGESREIAPVGTKLVGHDQAGDDSHSEVHGEDFRPEMVKIAEDRDFLPQPQTLEDDQIAREPDRDGGKDNVERDGESKLNSRQFQGT